MRHDSGTVNSDVSQEDCLGYGLLSLTCNGRSWGFWQMSHNPWRSSDCPVVKMGESVTVASFAHESFHSSLVEAVTHPAVGAPALDTVFLGHG